MVKANFYDLIDKKLSSDASGEEMQELGDLLFQLLPEKRVGPEEIDRAYARLLERMKREGILF